MKYRHSPYDFALDTVPISIGELDRTLKYNRVAMGALYDIVTPILYNTPGFRAGKFWFTLVNVTCTHTGYSHGLLPPPPKSCRPLAGTWFYTFALGPYGYDETTAPVHISLRGINTISWGNTRGNEFLTIATTHYQAEQIGITYDSLSPMRIYYLMGSMTKSFALRSRFYNTEESFQSLYAVHTPEMLRSQYHMMPFYNMFKNVPYHLWVFNRHAWMLGAQLLSRRHITPESLLYMCQNIRQISPLPKDVELEIVDQFHESMTDLAQRRNNNDELSTSTWQLLYTALVNRGKIPIKSVESWLAMREFMVKLPDGDYQTHILQLLYA